MADATIIELLLPITFHLIPAIFSVLLLIWQITIVSLNKIGNHLTSTRRTHRLKRRASYIHQDHHCFKRRKKPPRPRANNDKPWNMKNMVPNWSESALFLFKVMCSLEKAIHMIAYYASFPFHKYSRTPQFLAYKANHNLHQVRFDSDSYTIGVDNHCSATMSPNKSHFKDLKLKQIGECTGIGTGLTIAGKGTFLMNIEDDDGGIHKIEIPNSLYVPGLRMVLLSPQHWAQQAKDTIPDPMGTCMVNSHLSCTLYWNQKKFKKTVPFDDITNTPSFHTADRKSVV